MREKLRKPRPLFLNAREAQARAEGRLKCVIRPAKRALDGYLKEGRPYRDGDVVALKEAWYERFDGLDGVDFDGYVSDGIKPTGLCPATSCEAFTTGQRALCSSIIMTKEDCRHHDTVKSVECGIVGKMLYIKRCMEWGWEYGEGRTWDWDAITNEWLTRYPSHPWDSSWCWVITFKEKS